VVSGSSGLTASRGQDPTKSGRAIASSFGEPNKYIRSGTLLAHRELGPDTSEGSPKPFTLPNIRNSLSRTGNDDDLVLLELIEGSLQNNPGNPFVVQDEDGKGLNNNVDIDVSQNSQAGQGGVSLSQALGGQLPQNGNSEIQNQNFGLGGVSLDQALGQLPQNGNSQIQNTNFGLGGVSLNQARSQLPQNGNNQFQNTNFGLALPFHLGNVQNSPNQLPNNLNLMNLLLSQAQNNPGQGQNFGVSLAAALTNNAGSNQANNLDARTGLVGNLNGGVTLPILGHQFPSLAQAQQQSKDTSLNNVNFPTNSNSKNTDGTTVGDMLLNLDGLDGIKVLSLGDLKDSELAQKEMGEQLIQQLRNAMVSSGDIGFENIENELTNLLESQDLGKEIALDDIELGATEAGTPLEDAIDALSDIDVEKQVDAGVDAVVSDGNTTDTYDDAYALEENSDFEFEYDDFDPLPPQPPNVFRTKLTDIFFTKGQWIGTIIGGLIDIGSSVSGIFKKDSNESKS